MRALSLLLVFAAPQLPEGWTDCSPGTQCFADLPAPLSTVMRAVKPLVYAIDEQDEAQLTVVPWSSKRDSLDEAALRELVKGMKGVVERRLIAVGARKIARVILDLDKNKMRVRQVAYFVPDRERGVKLNFELAPANWEKLRATCDAVARAWAERED